MECEPGTLNRSKVQALKKIGVTRMSLGVENFDDAILRENGRAHESKETYQAYEWIEEADFPNVNIDLIAGMVGETEKNWEVCVRKTIELSPDSVTIYQMELPYDTLYSQETRVEGQPVAMAGWEQKRAWVGKAFAELERAGYRVSSGYTVTKGSKPGKFSYRDSLAQRGHGGGRCLVFFLCGRRLFSEPGPARGLRYGSGRREFTSQESVANR